MFAFVLLAARLRLPPAEDPMWPMLPADVSIPEGKAPVVDVTKKGYFKVGGKGLVAKPMVVKAKLFTAVAEKKIKAAKSTEHIKISPFKFWGFISVPKVKFVGHNLFAVMYLFVYLSLIHI